jgi:hypothetical protein
LYCLTVINRTNPDDSGIGELLAAHPDLSRDDVRACLAYAQALVTGEEVSPKPQKGGRVKMACLQQGTLTFAEKPLHCFYKPIDSKKYSKSEFRVFRLAA